MGVEIDLLFRRKGENESGDNSVEETPVPIPNTAVKLHSADDTWREAAWESRTLPVSCRDSRKTVFFVVII